MTLLTERAATILNSVLMEFLLVFNASQTSLFLRNLQGPDGRKGSGFQLKTEINLLHVLQLEGRITAKMHGDYPLPGASLFLLP
jgi:hypothetical protein